MAERIEKSPSGGWSASWITRPVQDHKGWEKYTLDAKVSIERNGGSLLFAVKDERNYCGCELNAAESSVILYAVEDGVRSEWGRAAALELAASQELTAASPASFAVRIELGERTVRVLLNERLSLVAGASAALSGTIGFETRAEQSATFRELRIVGENGSAMYVNRFYDPSVIQFIAGQIHKSGHGLQLDEDAVSICESPVPVDSPLFRKSFELEAEVVRAVLRVYSTGWYELSINGRKPDNRVLAPANSPYNRRMLYDDYDVTVALKQGGNAIGLWLGNGYNLNYSRWGWKWKRDKAVILQLDIELADGTTRQVVTDESWQTADSPLLLNDIYDGEIFDACRVQPGWDQFDFAADGWANAAVADAPSGTLEPNKQPPVRVWEPLMPARVLNTRDGAAVYDFGQNIAGWARIEAKGPSGSRVTLKYSELIDAEGRIDPWTNRNAKAKDVYLLQGGGGAEFYEPRFTYHGFRYVEVSGDAELLSIEAVPIHSDVRETGDFHSSDPLLNQIQSNMRWSLLNNLVSIPTDCCQRDERTPCQMDSAVVEEAAIQNFDMQLYYRKWLGDIEGSDSNPDWSGDQVTLPWFLYEYYGDQETLARQYPSMKSYIDHLNARWPEGVVLEGFGDWCPPNEDGWDNYFGEVEIVNTALYFRQALVVSMAAGVLGLEDDRKRYGQLAEAVKQAFTTRFYRGDGIYGSGSQTAQLMPLAYGMVPEAEVNQAVQGLVAVIADKNNHLDTGIYGTRYLLDVLADHGLIDLAYEILTQTDYPSFGYQIAQGATTLWEQWSIKGGMHSHDHAMFAGIGASFYTKLAGIQPLAPGYGRIGIAPHIPRKLEWAEARIETVHGLVASSWRKEGERVELDIVIPQNTTAVISLPSSDNGGREEQEVGPGRHRFSFLSPGSVQGEAAIEQQQ